MPRKKEPNWVKFDQNLWSGQRLPQEYKLVLLAFVPSAIGSAPTAVGYLRYGAGDKNSPYFVTPSVGGVPSYWCDCLPDNFGEYGVHPVWNMPKRSFKKTNK